MARPQRNEVDYFPFLCKEGKVMHIIESKFGNDGYATWIKLLRLLAVTNYHYLDLSNETEVLFVSSKCRVSEELLLEIIDTLVRSGEFDLYLWNGRRVLWSDKFVDSIRDAYAKRSNKPLDKASLMHDILGIAPPETPQKGVYANDSVENSPVNPHTILEYTIEKETKEEKQEIFNHSEIVQFVNKTFNKEFIDRNLTRLCRDCINDLITVHDYTKEQILTAWGNIKKDQFQVDKQFNIVTFNYLAETKTIERYLFWKDENTPGQSQDKPYVFSKKGLKL